MRATPALLNAVAAFCLALGITLPLIELERLFVLKERPSLIEMASGLWTGGDMLLAAIVIVASVVFPAAKILALQLVLVDRDGGATANGLHRWAMRLLPVLSKWSMLDVMLVAIAIFAAKTTGLAKAVTLPGLWFFAASTISSAIAAQLVARGEPKS